MIALSKRYNCPPSQILRIEDAYTAFCFDEACLYIMIQLENGLTAKYKEFGEEKTAPKQYNNFADFYKQFNENNNITETKRGEWQ